MSRLIELLKKQEGYRQHPYKCTEGYNTVAYGRNLDTVGIDKEEAEYLLNRDVAKCVAALSSNIGFWDKLDQVRQDALTNMAFQLGVGGLLKFKEMLRHLEAGQYHAAAGEALNSRWARQTPQRASEVAGMIRTGEY